MTGVKLLRTGKMEKEDKHNETVSPLMQAMICFTWICFFLYLFRLSIPHS